MANVLNLIPKWWPLGLALLGAAASSATSQARVSDLSQRMDNVEAHGVASTNERLARIEQYQADERKDLERMSGQLDRIEEKVR